MKQKQQNMLWRVQDRTLQKLLDGTARGDVLLLASRPASGRTTILRQLHHALGGAILGADDFARSASADECFLRLMEQAVASHRVVIADDLHVVTKSAQDNARAFLLDAALTAIVAEASVLRRKLIFGTGGDAPWALARRAWRIELE